GSAPARLSPRWRVAAAGPAGYHETKSLVVSARLGDRLALHPGEPLGLELLGPQAGAAGAVADNLVLKAAQALAERVQGLGLGRFVLDKRLPVAAGLGGGSADAAAALRLIARASDLGGDDPRLFAAARAARAGAAECL